MLVIILIRNIPIKRICICLGKSHVITVFNSYLRHLMLFQGYMVLARSPSKPDFYLSLLPDIFLGRIVQFSFLIHEKQLMKNSCCLSLSPSLSITRFLPGPALPRRQPPTPLSLFVFSFIGVIS